MLADTANLKRGINEAEGRLGKLGGGFAKFGKLAAAGMAVAGVAVGAWAKTSLDSLARIERINAQTAATIESTGGAANVSAKHIQNLTGHLEDLTATEAEATQEGANLLLTFTNIRNEAGKGNKVFDSATKTLVDMSRAMGNDPKSAAIQLGKALNDPVKGITALSRVGVSFTDKQKKMIEGFEESGKTMEAQKVILKELNKEFGGSGEAFAKTAEGQKALLGHAFGTLGETIFAPLLPWMTKATAALTKFVKYLTANVPAAMAKVKAFLKPAVDAFRSLGDAGGTGQSKLEPLMTFIKTQVVPGIAGIADAYMDLYNKVAPIVGQLVAVVVSKWSEIKPQVQSIWESVKTIIVNYLSIFQTYVRTATAIIATIWAKFGDNIKRYMGNTLVGLIKIISGAFKIVAGIFKTIAALLKGDWKGAWAGIKQILSGAMTVIKGIIKVSFAQVRLMIGAAWTVVKSLTSKAWDGIKKAVEAGAKGILALVKAQPQILASALSAGVMLFYNIGKNLVSGLINGIGSMANALIEKAKGVVSGAINAAKNLLGIHSPSKVFHKIGQHTIQGFINGFESGRAGVKAMVERMTDALKEFYGKHKAAAKAAIKAMEQETKALIKNAKKREEVYKKLAKAQERLRNLRQSAKDFASGVKAQAIEFGNITGLDTAFTSSALTAGLKDKVAQVKRFASLLKQLAKMGLNATTFRQIVNAGPDGGLAYAQALVDGGAAAIAEYNSAQAELNSIAGTLGDSTSSVLYDQQIQAAETYVSNLEKRAHRLERIAERMAEKFIAKVEKANGPKKSGGTTQNKTYNINVNVKPGTDKKAVAREIVNTIMTLDKSERRVIVN